MNKVIGFELNPLRDKKNKLIEQTQDKHIAQFNDLGKIMASCSDYYEAGKSNKLLVASLRNDFSAGVIMSSDRTFYDSDSSYATIISHYGGTIVQPSERRVFVPCYEGTELGKILADEQGLLYVQTLFNTTDSADEIKNTLAKLSGKNSRDTLIYTLVQEYRTKNDNIRMPALFFHCNSFRIDCRALLEGQAYAHEVRNK